MDLSFDAALLALLWYAVFIVSLTVHEAGHALAAWKLGDPTAYHGGQVTLNPIPHIEREPFGTILVPVASYLLSGWMLGWATAPCDPQWTLRYPRRAALMALAGPAGNLLLLLLAAALIRAGVYLEVFFPPDRTGLAEVAAASHDGWPSTLATLVSILFMLNLILLVFNLLPLPPLDGSRILPAFLRSDTAARYQEFMAQPMAALIGLLIAWKLFDFVFQPIHLLALNLLYPGSNYQPVYQ